MAASPVRLCGTVNVLNELIEASGCVSFREDAHAREFYLQNSYAIAQHLPSCATDIAGSFACAVVGCKSTLEQLLRLFGARRPMVQALYIFLIGKDNRLTGVHELAREAQFSEDNLRTFAQDGAIPSTILEVLVSATDENNTIARSTHNVRLGTQVSKPTASSFDFHRKHPCALQFLHATVSSEPPPPSHKSPVARPPASLRPLSHSLFLAPLFCRFHLTTTLCLYTVAHNK